MANVLNFGVSKRIEYMVDNDPERVMRLDIHDTGILGRWGEIQEWYEHADEKVHKILDTATNGEDAEAVKAMSNGFREIDAEMREKINYLFDEDVCTPIVGSKNGSVIRITDSGEPLYAVILGNLLPLYEQGIEQQSALAKKHVSKHTNKYLGDGAEAKKSKE